MSKLQDIISQAIFDGGYYYGAVTLNDSATPQDALFGIYNPQGSGTIAIITELRWCSAPNISQPFANSWNVNSGGISPPIGAGWLRCYRNLASRPVPVPVTTGSQFHQVFGSNPSISGLGTGNSIITCINYAGYSTGLGSPVYDIPFYDDIQPGIIYALSTYRDLTQSSPLILYPGDILLATNAMRLGQNIGSEKGGVWAEFIQVNV